MEGVYAPSEHVCDHFKMVCAHQTLSAVSLPVSHVLALHKIRGNQGIGSHQEGGSILLHAGALHAGVLHACIDGVLWCLTQVSYAINQAGSEAAAAAKKSRKRSRDDGAGAS